MLEVATKPCFLKMGKELATMEASFSSPSSLNSLIRSLRMIHEQMKKKKIGAELSRSQKQNPNKVVVFPVMW